ncbi:MAG: PD-(D/E)XK nuclease domain-containing protein, partial [Succinivibrio sp.]
GYCFDENGVKKVFSTWSVNKFFQGIEKNGYVQFGEYWYGNGGIPSILANYLKSHELNAADYLDKNKVVTVPIEVYANPTSLLDIDQNVLMCQTGYLTLKRSLSNTPVAVLGIPNLEVYKALNSLLALKIFGIINNTNEMGDNIFEVGSADEIISLLNTAINSISYEKFPINSEAHLVSIVQSYMYGARQNVIAQQNTSKGRADLAIETASRRIIFEFKYADNESDAKAKLNEAVEQIKTRDYGNILPQKELIRIAAVFNANSKIRAITEYQQA